MTYIRQEIIDGRINLYWSNNVYIGYCYCEIDGYYVFVFKETQGCWAGYALREIADILDALNKEWDEIVTNDLKQK